MDGTHRPVGDASLLRPGDVLGRYELLMPVARGGMGQVWAARLHGTRGFQKVVAVKTILPTTEDRGDLESMLFEEASLASLVRHPHVVEVLDLGERDDGLMYLAMEWVAGESLEAVQRAAAPLGGIPLPLVIHFVAQGLKGLHAAHEACNAKGERLGIVHRDVSPQNLLVSYAGAVKLIDFGIAKATQQQVSQKTSEGVVKGKFAYMAPEQLRSEPLDARADLFGMGIVLYRAATGVHPFHADNLAATIHKILTEDPQRPSVISPHCPKALDDVVARALAKDRSARFASAHEMLQALERTLPARPRGQSEKDSEAFMRRLFEPRMVERTTALQVALRNADAGAGVSPSDPGLRFPRSQPTMRAVSIETAIAPKPSENPASAAPGDGASALRRRSPRRLRAVTVPLALVALLALGAAAIHRPYVSSARGAGVAPASPRLELPAHAPPTLSPPSDVPPASAAPIPRSTGDESGGARAPLPSLPSAVATPATATPLPPARRHDSATRPAAPAATAPVAVEGPVDAGTRAAPPEAPIVAPDPLSRRK
jgi:serine/threonine-protein kinase